MYAPHSSPKRARVALLVLDGWGEAPPSNGNAITRANLTFLPKLKKQASYTQLMAAGLDVGLPEQLQGNSEAGHLNIGAGRIIEQDITLINREITERTLGSRKEMQTIIHHLKTHPTRTLHLIGLLSDGGVHSSIDHLLSLIDFLGDNKIEKIALHLITDGRDVGIKSFMQYYKQLRQHLVRHKNVRIASIIGRFYAMDRDLHQDRTAQALNLYFKGQGELITNVSEWVKAQYKAKVADEMFPPARFFSPQKTVIRPNDAVIVWNFRSDRVRQLLEGLSLGSVTGKKIITVPKPLLIASFIPNPKPLPVLPLVYNIGVKQPLAQLLSKVGYTQLHIAETEKYAQVTYFFNGGREEIYPKEDRILIDSGNFISFTEKTEMRAAQIAAAVIDKLEEHTFYDFIVANFANADMVAHTADMKATIKAVEVLDRVLSIFVPRLEKEGYSVIITADHGNAEEMISPATKLPDPSHSKNPVPFILVHHPVLRLRNYGRLADVAPTILELFGLPKPPEMTGQSLILHT